MKLYQLFDAEYKFMEILWDVEPVSTRKIIELCQDKLGWKRTTTYTVIKKLSQKGIVKKEDSIVSAIVKREEIQKQESKFIIEKTFYGSLPKFIAAFLSDKKLNEREIEEIKQIIDKHRGE